MKIVYVISLILTFALQAFSGSIFASELPSQIPVDPTLRRGVLRNGLSYYIRHNARPKGQADFYILSDVGAIQEEDDQQGLAHFLEHMAFNGTKSMPDKEIINYLEKIGVKFGANLNAATSWDYTIYMMKDLPVTRPNTVDSALLILNDWAGFIEPKREEIDKERGVIKEELRTRDGASWRSALSLIGALGRGTKYEHRNLIGTLEGLDSFEAESLERFYHDWYTPNHQAIIIVGDVDVDRVESQIKTIFKSLPKASRKAPAKELIVVENSLDPLIEIYADREMQYSAVQYYIRRQAVDKDDASTLVTARKNIEEAFISQMQSSRMREVVMSESAPILSGAMWLGRVGVIPTMEATTYSVQSPDSATAEALREVVTQMERTRRYGFTKGEFERTREELMSSAQSSYLNRNDRTNNSFIDRYVANYRFGEALPSAEDEWRIDSTLIASATLDAVNSRLEQLFAEDGHVIVVNSPERDGVVVPTKEELMRVISEVREGDVTPYEDSHMGSELLLDIESLRGSKVVSQSENRDFGVTEWQLENGVKVVVRPSDLKADEVIVSGYSDGGASLVADGDYVASMLLSSLMSNSGVGEYSAVELSKLLSGKMASLSLSVSDHSQGLRGGSRPADIETLMQLLYLNITSPRFVEPDFEIFRRRLRSYYENQAIDPDYQFDKRYAEVVYGGDFRRMPLSLEMIDSLELNSFKRVHDRLFSDADNLTFTFVGNIDLESFKPLVELYLGSLPSDPSNESMSYEDREIRATKGVVRDDFKVKMEQPKVGVKMFIWGEGIDYSLRNSVVFTYLKAALDDLLLESVREELGATYGVGVSMSVNEVPFEHYRISVSYDTNEEQIEQMHKSVLAQFEKIAREGVEQERMDKTREYLLKSYGNSKQHNSGWLGFITALYRSDMNYVNDYEGIVNSITLEDVRSVAQSILSQANRVEVVMHPER